jgi:hypothetical protein
MQPKREDMPRSPRRGPEGRQGQMNIHIIDSPKLEHQARERKTLQKCVHIHRLLMRWSAEKR